MAHFELKDLKYDDLITFGNDVYKLMQETNYNFIEDFYIFKSIILENRLFVTLKEDVLKFSGSSNSDPNLATYFEHVRLTSKNDLERIYLLKQEQLKNTFEKILEKHP